MQQLQKKTTEELSKMLAEKRDELRRFRFGIAGSKTKDVKAGRNLRKEIARICTELRRREIEANAE